ncbi:MAG: hypothetical protein GXO69_02790 [Acidobacteria bacterium]|nr:hypothetical protein [Acidobacteriota bacterium]
MRRQAGASNTEYILIVVLVALGAMMMVKGLGVELRSLFSGATNRLNLFDGDAPDDWVGDPDTPPPGPAPTPPNPTPPPPAPNPDTECRQQRAALQQERAVEGGRLQQAVRNARSRYNEAMRRERYWIPGHHSRWGRSSSGHWGYRYVHSAAERQAAGEQLNDAETAYREWNRDWHRRYQQWQSECGSH